MYIHDFLVGFIRLKNFFTFTFYVFRWVFGSCLFVFKFVNISLFLLFICLHFSFHRLISMQPDPLLSDNEHQAAIMLAACCSSGSSTTLRPVLSPPLLLQQFQDATAIIEETENPPNVDSSMLDPQIFPETVLSSEEQLAEKISKLRAEDDCFQTTLGQLKLDQNQIRALSRSGVKDLHFTCPSNNPHPLTNCGITVHPIKKNSYSRSCADIAWSISPPYGGQLKSEHQIYGTPRVSTMVTF